MATSKSPVILAARHRFELAREALLAEPTVSTQEEYLDARAFLDAAIGDDAPRSWHINQHPRY